MGFLQEFREFAVKGNAIDMAVGIVVGTAFNKIVNSIVSDLLMPPIGLLIGGVDFNDLSLVLQEGRPADAGLPEVAEVAIRYGSFLDIVIQFVIIAFSAFVVVKVMNRIIAARPAAS
jgi:large conductance mechanosensitive channel